MLSFWKETVAFLSLLVVWALVNVFVSASLP